MVTGDSRNPRQIPERDIQKAILQYLRIRGYLCKRNNAGLMLGQHKGKKWAIHIGDVGWPDIEGLVTGSGRYFGIEVKRWKSEPTEEQLNRGKEIIDSGGIWFVARSVDDVIEKGF